MSYRAGDPAAHDYDYIFKLLLIGQSGVGKSQLLQRFADDNFSETAVNTIGVDFKIRTVEADGKTVKLQIWDTAGQERFRTITSSYYRGAHGIILVYDVTDAESFAALPRWFEEIERYAGDCPPLKMIVGNKSDLPAPRQVEFDEGQAFADEHRLGFFEASAKISTNVDAAFTSLVLDVKKRVTTEPMSDSGRLGSARRLLPGTNCKLTGGRSIALRAGGACC